MLLKGEKYGIHGLAERPQTTTKTAGNALRYPSTLGEGIERKKRAPTKKAGKAQANRRATEPVPLLTNAPGNHAVHLGAIDHERPKSCVP